MRTYQNEEEAARREAGVLVLLFGQREPRVLPGAAELSAGRCWQAAGPGGLCSCMSHTHTHTGGTGLTAIVRAAALSGEEPSHCLKYVQMVSLFLDILLCLNSQFPTDSDGDSMLFVVTQCLDTSNTSSRP